MLLQKILLDWSSPLDNGRNDLVFENRNKMYGAYQLRRDYDMVLIYSVIGATGLLVALLCTQFLVKHDIVHLPKFDDGGIIVKNIVYDIPPPIKPILKLDPPKVDIKPEIQKVRGLDLSRVDLVDNEVVTSDVPIINNPHADINAKDPVTDVDPDPIIPTTNVTGGVKPNVIEEDNTIYSFPDVLPEYEGGESALFKYISSTVNYPTMSRELGEQTKVVVKFVIEKDGSVGNAEVVKGGGFTQLNKEALRVVKSMKKWKPGMSGGQPARVYFYLPINFVLKDN
jgi:protein TonB